MNEWAEQDLKLLSENYCRSTNSQLLAMFPGRSALAIYKKAYKMGMRKPAEIEFKNRSEARKREKGANWKGGIRSTRQGYRQLLMPEHPRAGNSGYVMEHIVVWERETGIPVPDNCCIHHLNGDKSDNRIQNLCMMQHAAHTVFHHEGKNCSAETKEKISQKAKQRFTDERNHPAYKEIDVSSIQDLIDSGMTIEDVCAKIGISKSTFYRKRRKQNVTK